MAKEHPILGGIRVIEVGTFILGPAAATVMSDFGAEVIKIEAPGIGDPYRYLHMIPPMPKSEKPYCWLLDGRNKKSVVLDLKKDAGRDVLLKLVEGADVLVTNYHPSVLTDLRLTYDDLRPLNEGLVYAHATGFGEEGPEVEMPGYDMTAWWARSGLMELVRPGHEEPALSVAGMGDHPSSMSLFGGITLALYAREKTGKGTKVSTSLMANGAWSNGCFIQSELCGAESYERRSRAEAYNALINHYETRDGKRFILCGIRADKDWIAVCHAIARTDLLEDERFATDEKRFANMPALVALFDAAFAEKDMAEWKTLFEEHELTSSPVVEYTDIPNDAQMRANNVFIEYDHPKFGKIETINSPVFLQDYEKVPPVAPPELGMHTQEVLGELGYSTEAIQELADAGIVFTGTG